MVSCKHETCQADKRTRFCDKQKASIKKWYKKGWTVVRIAKKFDTSHAAISRIISRKYRLAEQKRSNKINKARYAKDKEFRKQTQKTSREIMNARYHDDPDYRECKIKQMTEYYKVPKNYERLLAFQRKSYHNNK